LVKVYTSLQDEARTARGRGKDVIRVATVFDDGQRPFEQDLLKDSRSLPKRVPIYPYKFALVLTWNSGLMKELSWGDPILVSTKPAYFSYEK
jgi:hypothetical protein